MDRSQNQSELRDLAALFLKLGATAFGGPAAHIAMMEDEVVHRRGWMTHQEFLDLVGATNLIPGPNSTELAIHIGWRRARWRGLIIAGVCFIIPAVCIVLLLAWAYVRYGSLPEVDAALYGIKPVILAIIAQALWRLGRTALKTIPLALVGVATTALMLAGVNELLLLGLAGLLMLSLHALRSRHDSGRVRVCALPWLVGGSPWFATAAAGAAGMPAAFSLWKLGLFFVKVGSVLYGSGYVLLAFLRADLVERWGWLTESQLLDAIIAGQVTPGPVFTTATFVGYLLGGFPGAMVATGGIFLPAFVFVALSSPFIPRLRRSKLAGAFLDGLNVASLGLMLAVSLQLSRAAVVDWPTAALALLAGFALFRFRLNSTWLIAAGAVLGLLVSQWR